MGKNKIRNLFTIIKFSKNLLYDINSVLTQRVYAFVCNNKIINNNIERLHSFCAYFDIIILIHYRNLLLFYFCIWFNLQY